MLLQTLFKNNVKSGGMTTAKFLDAYSPIFTQFGRSIYASDVVQTCIDCIATECSKLTPQHVTIDDNGLPTPLQGDNFNRLFRFAPNPMMSTRDFIEKVIWQLYLNYNSFIYPTYYVTTDARGNQSRYYTAFWPLNPITVEFLQDITDTLFVRMTFYNGSQFTLPYADVIHLRKKFSISDVMGGGFNGQPDNASLLSVLQTNDTVIQGIGKAIKTTLAVRGIMKINTLLDDDKQKAERIKFEKTINDSDARTAILPMDMKGEYVPLTIDPKVIDKDTMEFLDSKVQRWFGVSLAILSGDYTDEKYQAFYNKTIEPVAIGLGQAFSSAIFTQREQDIGHEIKFYYSNLELMTTANKVAFVTSLGDRGILTDNQILALFGMTPFEDGNVRHMSLNYIDASLANTYQMAKVKSGTPEGGKQQ
jgi:HK97 family phage portal protein